MFLRKTKINMDKKFNVFNNKSYNTMVEIISITYKGKQSKNIKFIKFSNEIEKLVGEIVLPKNNDVMSFPVMINSKQGFKVIGLEGKDYVSIDVMEYIESE